MEENVEKLYEAYEHRFNKGKRLELKEEKVLEQVKLRVQKDILGDEVQVSEVSWYLSCDKEDKLKNNSFEVIACISWHMGIPFYKVCFNDEVYDIAEFYLKLKE
ncbi:MAG: hypothetical protein COA44_13245 [Arcobacter sp.]|nr:MAG: hypothetical protein COA44_13245 [Arcobacter sp.]